MAKSNERNKDGRKVGMWEQNILAGKDEGRKGLRKKGKKKNKRKEKGKEGGMESAKQLINKEKRVKEEENLGKPDDSGKKRK